MLHYRISCFRANCFQVALAHTTDPRGGSTQTGLALKYVLRKGFPGGRNATAAARIVILLSDGRSQGNVVQAAAALKETGAVLFAVGLRYPTYVYRFPLSQTWGENYCTALRKQALFPDGRSYMPWPASPWRATSSSRSIFTTPSTGCTQHCPPSPSATPHLKVRGAA